MSENQAKTTNSFKRLITVFDQAQIASNQFLEMIARNMKAYTIGESIILPVCKNIVSTMLGGEAAMKISKIPLSNYSSINTSQYDWMIC